MLFVWGSSASVSSLGTSNSAVMVVCVSSSSVLLSENCFPNFVLFMRVTFFLVLLIPALVRFICNFGVDGDGARHFRINSVLWMKRMSVNLLFSAASVRSYDGALKND